MNKVLVTGANGLLGSHVVRTLLQQNYSVRILVRKESNLMSLHGLNVEHVYGEITQKKDLEKAVEGCNFVIHIAARTTQTPSEIKPFQKVNIASVEYLIDICLKLKIKRLVFVSTANCFGNGTKENPGTEETPFLPWLKNSGYAYSKYLAQQKVLKATKAGLNAVIVNPTFIIGEKDFKPSSGQIFGHVLNRKLVLYPPGGKNFVDANMASKGVISAMKKGNTGNCYLLAGQNYSYFEFFKMVTNATRQKSILVPIPRIVLLFAGRVGDFIEKVFNKPVHLVYTNAKMLCLGNYFSPHKAITEIDFEMVSTKKSIEKAILWFNANGYFK